MIDYDRCAQSCENQVNSNAAKMICLIDKQVKLEPSAWCHSHAQDCRQLHSPESACWGWGEGSCILWARTALRWRQIYAWRDRFINWCAHCRRTSWPNETWPGVGAAAPAAAQAPMPDGVACGGRFRWIFLNRYRNDLRLLPNEFAYTNTAGDTGPTGRPIFPFTQQLRGGFQFLTSSSRLPAINLWHDAAKTEQFFIYFYFFPAFIFPSWLAFQLTN